MFYLCIHSLRSLFAAKDSFEMKLFYFSHNGCHPKAFNSAGFTFKVLSAKEFSASGSLNQLSRWQMKLFKTFICLKICSKYLSVFDKKVFPNSYRDHNPLSIMNNRAPSSTMWSYWFFKEMSCPHFLHKQLYFYKTSSFRLIITQGTNEPE